MRWSLKIAQFAGIGVYVHVTFLLILIWVGADHYLRGDGIVDTLHGILFIVALFSIVILHEFGHALAARRYGIATRDITLLPIGGVARLERMPEEPRQELVVALAGPAVNVALAVLLFFAVLLLTGRGSAESAVAAGAQGLRFSGDEASDLGKLTELPQLGTHFLARLILVNVILAAFNLLPAFPMDGGRVLRALLAMRTDYVRATQIAAAVGQSMALLFGFLGLLFNPFLVLIALFVWMGASREASMVQTRTALQGIRVQRAMITEFRTVSPEDRLMDVARHILAGFQQDFPVVQEGELVGILTKGELIRALAEQGGDAVVTGVMHREFETAAPEELLETALARLRQCECHSLPVVRGRDLVGVVTMENVGEFLVVQPALRETRA